MKTCLMCNGKLTKISRLCSNLKILGPFFSDSGLDIESCENCGLVQFSGAYLPADFLSYYTSDVSTPFNYYKAQGKDATNNYFEHIYYEISSFINPKSTILDVGGAWGELASFIKSKGYNDVDVVDPNPKCFDSMNLANINAYKIDASHMSREIGEKKYDLVILNHILEHIPDFINTILEVCKIISEDGYIYIEVPDAEEYNNCSDSPYFYLTYEHVVHFTENDLRNLASLSGLEIISMKKYFKKISQYPSIIAIMKKQEQKQNKNVVYSNIGCESVTSYIKKSKERINDLTKKYLDSQEAIILWGIGASTTQLLDGFEGCNITQLIDVNPLRQGLIYNISGKDYKICSPDECKNDKIVILSVPYEREIRRYIDQIGLTNKVCFLGE